MVADQVRIVDVMPTVLELLRVPAPPEVQGASLLPLARGERLACWRSRESWYPRYPLRLERASRRCRTSASSSSAPRGRELYDLQRDPVETNDLAASDPARGGRSSALSA